MKVARQIVYILFLICAALPLRASHIVGGEITYHYLGGNQYKIQLVLFIDCFNGIPSAIESDSTANIGLFNAANVLLDTFEVRRTSPIRISNASYSCIIPPSDACVDMYKYERVITLPVDYNGNFYLTFQRCCRNKTINNLVQPDRLGATYYVMIPGKNLVDSNSSAVFKKLPPNFLCAGKPFEFDHSAMDPDADSLVYGLYTPLDGATYAYPQPKPPAAEPYKPVPWNAGYDSAFPFGHNSVCTINSHTGKLIIIPNTIGQFVTGVYVKEYRGGKLVGETRRDYQFNVLSCQLLVQAGFAADPFYCKRDITFQNEGTADSFFWDFGVKGSETDTSSQRNPNFVFPTYGKYTIRQVAYSGNCTDTAYRTINILNPDVPFAIKDTLICNGDSVRLGFRENSGLFSYLWTPSTGLSNDTLPDPSAKPDHDVTYSVIRKYKQCTFLDTVQVRVYDPIADFISKVTVHCEGNQLDFTNTSSNAQQYAWYINGQKVSDEASPSFFFPHGTDVKGWMTATEGKCSDSKSFSFSFPDFTQLGFTIPNVITPNGDGMNDCFNVSLKNASVDCEYELYIFNRWGEMVYNNGPYCWDGTDFRSRKPLAPGVYFYVLKVAGQDYKGTVTLIR